MLLMCCYILSASFVAMDKVVVAVVNIIFLIMLLGHGNVFACCCYVVVILLLCCCYYARVMLDYQVLLVPLERKELWYNNYVVSTHACRQMVEL